MAEYRLVCGCDDIVGGELCKMRGGERVRGVCVLPRALLRLEQDQISALRRQGQRKTHTPRSTLC
jgi:hypothetical protein